MNSVYKAEIKIKLQIRINREICLTRKGKTVRSKQVDKQLNSDMKILMWMLQFDEKSGTVAIAGVPQQQERRAKEG